jgi:hypothetical protein
MRRPVENGLKNSKWFEEQQNREMVCIRKGGARYVCGDQEKVKREEIPEAGKGVDSWRSKAPKKLE